MVKKVKLAYSHRQVKVHLRLRGNNVLDTEVVSYKKNFTKRRDGSFHVCCFKKLILRGLKSMLGNQFKELFDHRYHHWDRYTMNERD